MTHWHLEASVGGRVVRVLVGVVLHRKLAVRLLDVLVTGICGVTEDDDVSTVRGEYHMGAHALRWTPRIA